MSEQPQPQQQPSEFDASGISDRTYQSVERNKRAILARAAELPPATNDEEMNDVLRQISGNFSQSYGQKILNAYMHSRKLPDRVRRAYKRQLNLKYSSRLNNAMHADDIVKFAERCIDLLQCENDTDTLIVASAVILLSFTGKRVFDILNLTLEDLKTLRSKGIITPYIVKAGLWSRITLRPDQMKVLGKIIEALDDRLEDGDKLYSKLTGHGCKTGQVPWNVIYKKFNNLYVNIFNRSKPKGLGFHALRSGYAAGKFVQCREQLQSVLDGGAAAAATTNNSTESTAIAVCTTAGPSTDKPSTTTTSTSAVAFGNGGLFASSSDGESFLRRAVGRDLDHSARSKVTDQYINRGLTAKRQ